MTMNVSESDEHRSSLRSSCPKKEPRPTRASLLRVRRENNSNANLYQGRSSRMPPLRSPRAPSMPSPAWEDVESNGISRNTPSLSSEGSEEPWQNMSQQRRQNPQLLLQQQQQQQMRGGSGSGRRRANGRQQRSTNNGATTILPDAVGGRGQRQGYGDGQLYGDGGDSGNKIDGFGDEVLPEEGFPSSSQSSSRSTRSDGSNNNPNNFGEMELLPGWEAATDPNSGKPYYFNRETGARTWDWRKVISQAPKQRPMYSPRVEKKGKEKPAPRRPKQRSQLGSQKVDSPRARRARDSRR